MMLGDKLHTKNNENACFFFESCQTMFYFDGTNAYIDIQLKKYFKKFINPTGTIALIKYFVIDAYRSINLGKSAALNQSLRRVRCICDATVVIQLIHVTSPLYL